MAGKIIGCVIGRNEENRYLKQVLDRLTKQVDIVCFVDDCSDDNTLEIASSYSNVTYGVMKKPTFTVDEHELRAAAWSLVEKNAEYGDWVLSIDCDEELYGLEYGKRLMNNPQWDVLAVTFYHMWNETQYRADGSWAPIISSRLYKYKEGGTFRNRKLACGAEPSYVQDMIKDGHFCRDTPLRMKHLGYQTVADQRAKYKRYMKLDGGEFHSINHLQSILAAAPRLEDWHD